MKKRAVPHDWEMALFAGMPAISDGNISVLMHLAQIYDNGILC